MNYRFLMRYVGDHCRLFISVFSQLDSCEVYC